MRGLRNILPGTGGAFFTRRWTDSLKYPKHFKLFWLSVLPSREPEKAEILPCYGRNIAKHGKKLQHFLFFLNTINTYRYFWSGSIWSLRWKWRPTAASSGCGIRKYESNYELLLSNLLKYLQPLSGWSNKMIPHSQTSFSHHVIAHRISTSVCGVFISI